MGTSTLLPGEGLSRDVSRNMRKIRSLESFAEFGRFNISDERPTLAEAVEHGAQSVSLSFHAEVGPREFLEFLTGDPVGGRTEFRRQRQRRCRRRMRCSARFRYRPRSRFELRRNRLGRAGSEDGSSSREFEARRLAPCTPLQATSPTAKSPAMLVRPSRSVLMPPMK